MSKGLLVVHDGVRTGSIFDYKAHSLLKVLGLPLYTHTVYVIPYISNILGRTWSLVTRLKHSVWCCDKCVPKPCENEIEKSLHFFRLKKKATVIQHGLMKEAGQNPCDTYLCAKRRSNCFKTHYREISLSKTKGVSSCKK